MIPALCVAQPSLIPTNNALYNVLQSLGLTSGLQTCLDASDAASYSGSGQTWVDETGNGYSFFLGTTGSGEASDPTFNGTAGSQTSGNYWTFNGSQWFTLNQANPTWVTSLHQDNAIFTVLAWGWTGFEFGDDAGSGVGVEYGQDGSLHPQFVVFNGPSTVLITTSSTLAIPIGSWSLSGLSFNETTGTATFTLNGAFDVKTGQTYVSPSASGAAAAMQIGAFGSGFTPTGPLGRYANFALWTGVALTQAQITGIFNATRAKFGV